jgi:phage shock protein A
MGESLVARVRRIISGNVKDLIDSLEQANAGVVMREAIREIEDAIGDVQDELGHAAARSAQIARHLEWLRGKHEELTGKVDIALSEGREDLAGAAIARQMELEAQIAAEEEALRESTSAEKEYVDLRASLTERRRDMEKQYRDWQAASRQARVEVGFGDMPGSVDDRTENRAMKAEKAFSRAISGGEFAPDASVLRETAAKMNELDKLTRDKELARRLAEAKARHAAA